MSFGGFPEGFAGIWAKPRSSAKSWIGSESEGQGRVSSQTHTISSSVGGPRKISQALQLAKKQDGTTVLSSKQCVNNLYLDWIHLNTVTLRATCKDSGQEALDKLVLGEMQLQLGSKNWSCADSFPHWRNVTVIISSPYVVGYGLIVERPLKTPGFNDAKTQKKTFFSRQLSSWHLLVDPLQLFVAVE